jgi:hypothetical protein
MMINILAFCIIEIKNQQIQSDLSRTVDTEFLHLQEMF